MQNRRVVLGWVCFWCDKAAVYFKERPVSGDKLRANIAFNHESKPQPVSEQKVKCQWCGKGQPIRWMRSDLIYDCDYETGKIIERVQ